jgi:hypothetical protein
VITAAAVGVNAVAELTLQKDLIEATETNCPEWANGKLSA